MANRDYLNNLTEVIYSNTREVSANIDLPEEKILSSFLITNTAFNLLLERYEKLFPGFNDELVAYEAEKKLIEENGFQTDKNLSSFETEQKLRELVLENINESIVSQKEDKDFVILDAKKCLDNCYNDYFFEQIRYFEKQKLFEKVSKLAKDIEFAFSDLFEEFFDYCNKNDLDISIDKYVAVKKNQLEEQDRIQRSKLSEFAPCNIPEK